MQKQGIDLRPVITATYELADAADAVAATDDPENIKVHLTF
jgi:threonine dehydrogenase-like Zn-dependent dehydrogenase